MWLRNWVCSLEHYCQLCTLLPTLHIWTQFGVRGHTAFLLAAMEETSNSLWDESSMLFSCMAMFFAIYITAFYIFFSGWKRKARLDAASCCMSLVHATTATLVTAYDILRTPWKLDAPNTTFQERVMEFSSAYFLVDLLHYIVFLPSDYIFILHHIATTTYILSCRYYTKHGAVSVMALLGLAESTAPLQNLWTLAFLAREDSLAARRIYYLLSPIFTVLFTFVRGVLGPCLTWNLSKYYFTGQADAVIPRWLASYWMATVILAITGSLLWVSKLWVSFIGFYERKVHANTKLSKSE